MTKKEFKKKSNWFYSTANTHSDWLSHLFLVQIEGKQMNSDMNSYLKIQRFN